MRIAMTLMMLIAAAGCGGGGNDDGGPAPERLVVAATTEAPATGVLLRSDDGGTTWKTALASARELRDVAVADDRRGAAVGDGVAFFTRDRGSHWSPSRIADDEALADVAFAGNGHGFAVGATLGPAEFQRTPLVLETIDAGEHWAVVADVPVGTAEMSAFAAACFTASGSAVVLGESGTVVVRHDDTGWTDVTDRVPGDPIDGLACTGGEHVWLFEESLLHSDNGGVSWQRVTADFGHPSLSIQALAFVDDQHGWLVGTLPVRVTAYTILFADLIVLRTADGGATWTDVPLDQFTVGSWSEAALFGDGSRIAATAAGFSGSHGALLFTADESSARRLALPPGLAAARGLAIVSAAAR